MGNHRHLPNRLEPADLDALYKAAQQIGGSGGARALAILALMHKCGLRKGEVINLRTSEIFTRQDEPMLYVRDSKFGASRNVPIDPGILDILHQWEAARPRRSEWYICTHKQVTPNNGIAKGNPPGSKLSEGAVWDIVRRVATRAGVERRVHPHAFRHTAATEWLEKGVSLEHIRRLLGHRSIKTTQVYTHVSVTDLKAVIYNLAPRPDGLPFIAPLEAPQRPAAAMPALIDTRPLDLILCPYCAEEIKAAAKLCRYCRSDL